MLRFCLATTCIAGLDRKQLRFKTLGRYVAFRLAQNYLFRLHFLGYISKMTSQQVRWKRRRPWSGAQAAQLASRFKPSSFY